MANANDIFESLRMVNQNPLDGKTYKVSEIALKDLGTDNNLAYTYGQGLIVYCVENGTRWEWRQPTLGEIGLLTSNFVYPANYTSDYINYSNKAYNFFPYNTGGTSNNTDQVFNEIPIGILDGINITFISTFSFKPETIQVILNGMIQKPILDYITVGSNTIQLTVSPGSTENLLINYTKL
jgi:hypothetical protein